MYYIGNSIIKNGKVESLSEQEPIGLDNEIYELLRVQNGKPIFLTDHLNRLSQTLIATGYDANLISNIGSLIDWLIICNQQNNCNLRITVSSSALVQAGFVPSEYPTKQMYDKGVKTSILDATRTTPKLKIYHAQMRQEALDQQTNEQTYESLLINKHEQITEGSRSNVFFIKGNTLYTAPSRMVLGGIIRDKVIEICKLKGIQLLEIPVDKAGINTFDTAFLTSTPMRILPISAIGNVEYKRENKLLSLIMDEIENLVNNNKKSNQ